MKYLLSILLAGIIGGLIVLFSIQYITDIQQQLSLQPIPSSHQVPHAETNSTITAQPLTPSTTTGTPSPTSTVTTPKKTNQTDQVASAQLDFTKAADKTLPTVVHITSKVILQKRRQQRAAPNIFDFFWGDPWGDDPFPGLPPSNPRYQQSPSPPDRLEHGSGSGVIISADGFIVTNNHVIDEADEIEVVLNDKRSYTAIVVGTDPSTDIAVLKIEEQDLIPVTFANSDALKVGQWVVAVGNPFSLESTVTAGIVSAKARNINILDTQTPIESFIQTDAAVNPGNSGGALVNLDGDLVGINTAIATPTGVYAGYSFAIPSNIVAKVMEDLQDYGVVQRAFLGTFIREVNGKLAKELQLSVREGVLVDSLLVNSAAETAGILPDDVIVQIDEVAVKTVPELLEQIGRHRPGDEVYIKVIRADQPLEILVRLKNKEGKEDIVVKDKVENALSKELGIALQNLEIAELEALGLENGVEVVQVFDGKVREQTEMEAGFILTTINGQLMYTVEDVWNALADKEGGVLMEGKYPEISGTYYFGFGL